jgi:hypothetical protein
MTAARLHSRRIAQGGGVARQVHCKHAVDGATTSTCASALPLLTLPCISFSDWGWLNIAQKKKNWLQAAVYVYFGQLLGQSRFRKSVSPSDLFNNMPHSRALHTMVSQSCSPIRLTDGVACAIATFL